MKGINYLFFPHSRVPFTLGKPSCLTPIGFRLQRLDGIAELLKSTPRDLKFRVQSEPRHFVENRNIWAVGIQLAHLWT